MRKAIAVKKGKKAMVATKKVAPAGVPQAPTAPMGGQPMMKKGGKTKKKC